MRGRRVRAATLEARQSTHRRAGRERGPLGLRRRSALIELRSDGALDATFIDRAAVDRVSASLAAPVYRRSGSSYRMDAGGCERMICDLVDFFSGTREPGFTFVGAYASGSRFASAT